MGAIFNLQRYCVNDGQGIRTCVFFKGCPLNCPWCHNPEGIDGAINEDIGELGGKEISASELTDRILRDKTYYALSNGGVTFSGGEPLLQTDFIIEVAKLLQKEGVDVAIETCGCVPSKKVESVMPYINRVLFDIKQLDAKLLKKVTGGDLMLILQNLNLIDSFDLPITLRVPLIKEFNLNKEFLFEIAKLASSLKNVESVELLPYHNFGESKRRRMGLEVEKFSHLTNEQKKFAFEEIKNNYPNVKIL